MSSMMLEAAECSADAVSNEAFTATVQCVANATSVLSKATLPATKIAGSYPIAPGTKDQVELAQLRARGATNAQRGPQFRRRHAISLFPLEPARSAFPS
jgi:hypothetical protein